MSPPHHWVPSRCETVLRVRRTWATGAVPQFQRSLRLISPHFSGKGAYSYEHICIYIYRLHDCPFPTCDCMVFQPRVTSCHLKAATEQKFRWFIPPSVPHVSMVGNRFPAASWQRLSTRKNNKTGKNSSWQRFQVTWFPFLQNGGDCKKGRA